MIAPLDALEKKIEIHIGEIKHTLSKKWKAVAVISRQEIRIHSFVLKEVKKITHKYRPNKWNRSIQTDRPFIV